MGIDNAAGYWKVLFCSTYLDCVYTCNLRIRDEEIKKREIKSRE